MLFLIDFIFNIHYQLLLACCMLFMFRCKFKEKIQSRANTFTLSFENNQSSSNRACINYLWYLLFNFRNLNLFWLLFNHLLSFLLIAIVILIFFVIVTLNWLFLNLLLNFSVLLLNLLIRQYLFFTCFRICSNNW